MTAGMTCIGCRLSFFGIHALWLRVTRGFGDDCSARFRGRLPPRMDCNDGCWRSGHVITQADDVVVVGLVVELEVVAVALQAELDVASVDLRPMKRL